MTDLDDNGDPMNPDGFERPMSKPERSTFGEPVQAVPAETKLRSADADPRRSADVIETRTRRRSKSSQARRPVVTGRRLRWIEWMGEQYGTTYRVAAHVLSERADGTPLSDAGVRQQVEALAALGLVSKHRRFATTWVVPTRAGHELVGQRFPVWAAPESRLAHSDAVNAARVWYESNAQRPQVQGRWISERRLFAERGRDATWHLPDALLRRDGVRQTTSIEVELHVKTPRQRYVDEVFGRLHPDVSTVLYLCPENLKPRLRANVQWAVSQAGLGSVVTVHVRTLPLLGTRS